MCNIICGLNLIRAHRTSCVPIFRPAPSGVLNRLISIFIPLVSCFLFCFTKAVLHKAATFGNYPVCISIYKMISASVLSLTDVCKHTILPFFLAFYPSHSFSPFLIFCPCYLHPKREMQIELREFSKFSAQYLSTKFSFKSDVNPKAQIDVCWSTLEL